MIRKLGIDNLINEARFESCITQKRKKMCGFAKQSNTLQKFISVILKFEISPQ